MGVRNATVRRLGIPDLTTTVLTLTLTGLAADTQVPGGEPGATLARRLSAVGAGAALGSASCNSALARRRGAAGSTSAARGAASWAAGAAAGSLAAPVVTKAASSSIQLVRLLVRETVGAAWCPPDVDAGRRTLEPVSWRPAQGGRGPDAASCRPRMSRPPVMLSASGRRHGWLSPSSLAGAGESGSGSFAPARVSAESLKNVQVDRSSGGSGLVTGRCSATIALYCGWSVTEIHLDVAR